MKAKKCEFYASTVFFLGSFQGFRRAGLELQEAVAVLPGVNFYQCFILTYPPDCLNKLQAFLLLATRSRCSLLNLIGAIHQYPYSFDARPCIYSSSWKWMPMGVELVVVPSQWADPNQKLHPAPSSSTVFSS